jgi:hypothetical protein
VGLIVTIWISLYWGKIRKEETRAGKSRSWEPAVAVGIYLWDF